MLDELNPLTGERAVLAQMARQLAATLDGMDPAMSARMAGQTRGQLLKVLDKLGAQRREEGPAGAAAQDASSVRPRRQATRSGSRASKTSSTPKSCRGSSRSTPAGWGSQCLAPWRTPKPMGGGHVAVGPGPEATVGGRTGDRWHRRGQSGDRALTGTGCQENAKAGNDSDAESSG
jgi:hypothetical protein